jgi:hypothetical protein
VPSLEPAASQGQASGQLIQDKPNCCVDLFYQWTSIGTTSAVALLTPRWYASSAISTALSSRLLASMRVHVPLPTME